MTQPGSSVPPGTSVPPAGLGPLPPVGFAKFGTFGDLAGGSGQGGPTLYVFVAAVIGYLIVVSFLTPRATLALSALLIMGALFVNRQTTGGQGVFKTLGLGG